MRTMTATSVVALAPEHHDALVAVAGGLQAVLIVAVIVREQTDDPEVAGRRSAEAAAARSLDEPHGLPDTIPMCIHSGTLLYL